MKRSKAKEINRLCQADRSVISNFVERMHDLHARNLELKEENRHLRKEIEQIRTDLKILDRTNEND